MSSEITQSMDVDARTPRPAATIASGNLADWQFPKSLVAIPQTDASAGKCGVDEHPICPVGAMSDGLYGVHAYCRARCDGSRTDF